MSDGWCDDITNNADCNWDGGDCCGDDVKTSHFWCTECECLDPAFNNGCMDDDRQYCKENFDKEYGWCDENPDFANECKRTCGKCEGACEDQLAEYWCDYYLSIDYCQFKTWKEKCIKTCEIPCDG